jgi:hypothetical protein
MSNEIFIETRNLLEKQCFSSVLYYGPDIQDVAHLDSFEDIVMKMLKRLDSIDSRLDSPFVQSLPSVFSIVDLNSNRTEGTVPPDLTNRVQSYRVNRTGSLLLQQTVKWEVFAGAGATVNAADFIFFNNGWPKGLLVFEPGESSKTINLKINPDASAEPLEFYRIRILEPTNGATLNITTTISNTIINDD